MLSSVFMAVSRLCLVGWIHQLNFYSFSRRCKDRIFHNFRRAETALFQTLQNMKVKFHFDLAKIPA